jgi:hypothetical protein
MHDTDYIYRLQRDNELIPEEGNLQCWAMYKIKFCAQALDVQVPMSFRSSLISALLSWYSSNCSSTSPRVISFFPKVIQEAVEINVDVPETSCAEWLLALVEDSTASNMRLPCLRYKASLAVDVMEGLSLQSRSARLLDCTPMRNTTVGLLSLAGTGGTVLLKIG